MSHQVISLNDVLLQNIQTYGWMDILLHALLIITALISYKAVKICHKMAVIIMNMFWKAALNTLLMHRCTIDGSAYASPR